MVIDIETTGNKVDKDKIIQIGAVLLEGGEIIEQFSSFVNPNMELSPFIKQFTGIEDEMLKRAPTFDLIAPMLLEMLEESYFVAHNVPFDLAFLREEFINGGYQLGDFPTIDTVELSRLLYPSLTSYKLNQLASEFSIEHDQPHRADSDAEVTAQLLLKLLTKICSLPLTTLIKINELSTHLQSDIGTLLQEIIQSRKQLKHSDGNTYEIYRGFALKTRPKLSSRMDDYSINFLNKDVTSMLMEIQKIHPSFEIRNGQIEMIKTIDKAFQHHFHALIEAGTGTGKTIGYLIPSILYAKQTGYPVVVSTYTTQLQEQIMTDEMTILQKAFPFSVHTAILKGRHHYLCMRKFEQSIESSQSDNYDTILTKAQILVWLTETTEGDVDELNLTPGGKIYWHKVKSDSNSCINHHCPWFSRCFYQQKRQEVQAADMIITNHALLLTDLKSHSSILPAFNEIIIDEAHHLEEVASENLGIQLDYFSIQTILNQIGLINESEFLDHIFDITNKHEMDFSEQLKKIEEQYLEVKGNIDELFRNIRSYALNQTKKTKNEIGRISYQYNLTKEKGSLWKDIKNYAYISIDKIEDLISSLQLLLSKIQVRDEQVTKSEQWITGDIKSFIQSLEGIANDLCGLFFDIQTNQVTWIEVEPKGAQNSTFLFSQPIDKSEILANRLFANKQSVILTSATLAIKESFDYIRASLGLYDFEVMTKRIPSPFTYKEQVQLMIPTDIPQIKDVDQEQYILEMTYRIIQIAKITEGKMLILFTSYDMLEKVYHAVKATAELDSFVLIGQGISSGSRSKLTRNFKQFDRSILFGTSSFWEGIDIPGDDLSCIVIVKLPFSPPDHPVMAAKAQLLKQDGKNAFMELYLPQAILRFKQGFGRLVRAKNDRGVVFVLDRRIISKSYGKKFIAALPAIEILEEQTDVLIEKLSHWL